MLLQGAVDLLFSYMELLLRFGLPFPEELMTALKIVVLKRLQDKLATIDVAFPAPQDIRFKVEIKICLDFVKALLSNSKMITKVFIDNDFTSVKRPFVTSLLNTCVKVLSVD